MARTIQISSEQNIVDYLSTITRSSGIALHDVQRLIQSSQSVSALAHLKFNQVGRDPLDPNRSLNLIEQINQTFTYIATLRATKALYELHPNAENFTLKMGAISGTDIESIECGGIAAEVFSAVIPSNNNKLNKDVRKVARVNATHKYVFFMCPGIEAGERPSKSDFPDVRIWSLGTFNDNT